jgi:hypothetical protein
MRKTQKIKFYLQDDNSYDPYADEYGADSPKLVAERYANVTDLGTNRSVELLGKLDQNAKVVRLELPFDGAWSYLTIDDSPIKYRLETLRTPLKGISLIVGEDDG